MQWVAVLVSDLRSVEFMRAPLDVKGAWVCLLTVAAERETGGVLEGTGSWTNGDWLKIAGCTKRTVQKVVDYGLARWCQSGDTRVLQLQHYDVTREMALKTRRELNSKAAKIRWNGHAQSNAHASPRADAREELEKSKKEDPPKPPKGVDYPEDFERFWVGTNKRGSKYKALKAWLALGRPFSGDLLSRWSKWEKTRQWREGFAKHPVNWLSGRMHEQDPEQEQLPFGKTPQNDVKVGHVRVEAGRDYGPEGEHKL